MSNSPTLLSVCIPTYNRASYLGLCLLQLCKQIDIQKNNVEIIIGDNCSEDNTSAIVQQFINSGFPVKYFRHERNLGADKNVAFCLEQSNATYSWVMGDDDLLLDRNLKIILDQLASHKFNHLYLGNYWFHNDYEKERPAKNNPVYAQVFSDKKKYLKAINIWTTFLSAHIFKSEVLHKIELDKFIGSNLNQMQWVMASMFTEGDCLYMRGNLLACKGNNTGGYSLFQSFGTNLNVIVTYLAEKRLVPNYALRILNYYFIKDFMPQFCIQYKQKKLTGFEKEESPFKLLQPLYKSYPVYWFVLKPVDWLPAGVAKKYYFGLKLLKII